MNDLTFNPDEFLSQSTDQQMDTRFTPIPVGEFPAIVDNVAVRQQQSDKDPSVTWTILDVTYAIDDAGVREETGLDKPTIRQSIFLDLDGSGKLDSSKGKNVNLGRLREALGLNQPGVAFSFHSLKGQACIVSTKHAPNKNDPDSPYSNVSKVGALT